MMSTSLLSLCSAAICVVDGGVMPAHIAVTEKSLVCNDIYGLFACFHSQKNHQATLRICMRAKSL